MKTFLDKVRQEKLKEISASRHLVPEHALWEQVETLNPPSSFAGAIQRSLRQPLSIIAEVKAKAPNRENVKMLDPEHLVKDYEAGGAKAVSVLTDKNHFGGSLETLEIASQRTTLPLLHKEFIIHPYQLLQGRIRGASAALILVYYFQETELKSILEHSREIGLQAVVECSLEEEIPRALDVNPDILLINNRAIASIPANPVQTYNQGSVEVSVNWWKKWKALREWKAQPGKTLISASCISTPEHVARIVSLPFDAILIGNAAMMARDRVGFLKKLNVFPCKNHL